VAAGAAVLAVGTDALVWDAACADAVLLCRDEVVVAVAAANAELVAEPSVDAGVRLARVAGTGERLAGVDRALALDRGALATAAQLVGLGLGLLEQATSYAGTRHQFGRAIGSFQAVKHHLADVYIALSFAGPVVRRAAATLDPVDISHAKSAAADAAQLAARVALQVHGAIGYTFEHDLHMWLKRVWSLAPLFGDAATHRRRVADALLDG
jgi:alkylation response protein AidB-like acyl-CoA dehydrogenase